MSASARLASELLELLASRGETISTAESVTGGGLASAITDVAGSSKIFAGSLVTYSDLSKVHLLGIEPDLIAKFGVVSSEVAIAMAEGAKSRLGTTWSISTTGIAGPGSFAGVPAGRVWLAVVGPISRIEKLELGDLGREQVRDGAVIGALALITRILRERSASKGLES
ncbi:MAG: CinA family protein [Actinobacteria bacterium]|nr:CinA family protein [Actinomycetota bacterium]